MGQKVLGTTLFVSLLISLNGLHYVYSTLENGRFGNLHNCLWFILEVLASAFGLLAIALESYEGLTSTGDYHIRIVQALQYHYFFSWMGLIVGYSSLVTQTWMTYRDDRLPQIHVCLTGIPILVWLKRKSNLIVTTTQTVTTLAILSHSFMAFLYGNMWAFFGSFLMLMTLIAMSLPVWYTFLLHTFSTREVSLLLSAMASLVFPCAIAEAAHHRQAQKMENNVFG